jgi:hypothetical protein
MNWQRVLQAAVAIGAIGILGLTVLASEGVTILQGQKSLAPAGVELSDDELLQVEGELAPLVVLALGVVSSAAFGAGADLAWQAGFGDGDINWIQVGYVSAVSGAAGLGGGLVAGGAALWASALRYSAMASAAMARGATAAGHALASGARTASGAVTAAARVTGSSILAANRAAAGAIVEVWNWITRKP